MKRLFLFLLTAVCLFGQSQNVTVIPSPGSGGMNTGTFSTQGINYYLGKTGTTWDFSQVTLILPSSLAFVSTITAGAGINVSQSTGAVTISNTGVLAITPGTGITESIVGGTVTLNNSGVLAITAGNGVSVSGTQANITINAIAAGTVTSVSAVGQNGIGATTTNSTTNPVITLNLGSITPSSVTTGGLATVGSLRTSNLTGYLYGNGASNVTASTTIPSTAITGLATVATTGNYNDLLNKPTLNAGTVTSVATSGSVNGITLTGGTITSSGTITLGGTLSGITNSQLTNNSITIAGTATALGGSISQDTITGLSTTGIVKRTGANTLAIATSGSDYAPATSTTNILYGNGSGGFSPVTVGSGLTFTAGTLASTSGGGSVTSVSVSPNNGVTAGVTNSTTTPTISIGLGAITPTSVTTNTMTFGVNTGVLTVTAGTVGSAAITGSGQAVFNSGPSISAPTITGAATAVNLTTSGLESVANLKTSGLTGYLYGNSTTNVTASTTIPTSSLSGSVSLTSQVSGILPIANGGTGSSTASLVAGTGIAITGTFPNQTINATGGTGTVTSVSVTGNSGVLAGVATATTTPAISIGLGNITPTSVNAPIGNTTPSTGAFTTLNSSGQTLLATSTGNVGIGSTSPTSKLFVNSTSTAPSPHAAMYYDNPTAFFTTGDGGQANTYARIAGGLYGGASSTNLDLLAFCNDFTYPVGFRIGAVTSGTVGGHGQSEDLVFNYLKWGSYGDTLSANEFMRYGTSPQTSGDNRTLWIESNASSTSTTSGALVVTGGVGVGGALFSSSAYIGGSNVGLAGDPFSVQATGAYQAACTLQSATGDNQWTEFIWNTATAGTNTLLLAFGTDTSFTYRGGILYSRGSGVILYITSSDRRLKTPLRSWSLGDKFDELSVGEFNWLETGNLAHGTIAQDLYKIYPDAVSVGTDEKDINGNLKHPWSVDYGKLTVPLIAEVKTLRSRVKTLEQEQATTTQQLNDLTAKFNQYISTHP